MRRITLLISIGLLVVVYLTLNILSAQNPPTAAAISDLERPIHACEQQVASWRSEELVEIAFVVAVIVFGVIISSLHALNDNWARKTTLALGVATAILTVDRERINREYEQRQRADAAEAERESAVLATSFGIVSGTRSFQALPSGSSSHSSALGSHYACGTNPLHGALDGLASAVLYGFFKPVR